MSGSIFERTLSTAEMAELFSDRSLVAAMLAFESALAEAEAAEGAIPAAAAAPIMAACGRADLDIDIDAIVDAARSAGSIAIPLVKQLTARVAEADPAAAAFVHWGSTSQDVIDSAMAIVTRRAVDLLDADLGRIVSGLLKLARAELETPMLARTLMQPAQVISVGFKLVAWVAPLVRARARLAAARDAALSVQLGGAVGTLATLGEHGPAVARRVAERLGLGAPQGAWHVQRDAWVALGCEVAVLCGSLGKIGRDLALLAQGEVEEMKEPAGAGRGGSSAMPNKRNPVAAMIAIAAAVRAPHHAAALLAAMPQEHERGLGGWQAELAEWPALLLAAHGSLRALADAASLGFEVDAARMRRNIDVLCGTVFAEAAAAVLARRIGKAASHALLARLVQETGAGQADLHALVCAAAIRDPALAGIASTEIDAAFDVDAAAARAGAVAAVQLDALEAMARREGEAP